MESVTRLPDFICLPLFLEISERKVFNFIISSTYNTMIITAILMLIMVKIVIEIKTVLSEKIQGMA